jgi:flagellar L-ring protein precursor FlgH
VKKILALALIALSVSAHAQVSDDNPGSLWPSRYVNPLTDRTARRVGDLLTILISESATANFAATHSTSKKDATEVERSSIPLLDRINIGILNDLLSSQSTGASSSTSGSGQTTNTGRLVTRMTVVVKEVLPNGTMVIEGTREVRVNKETQIFKLSGIVRQDDVRSDNTLFSENIGEARIQLDAQGAVAQRLRRGILTRILDWLF